MTDKLDIESRNALITFRLLEPRFGRIYDDTFNHRHSGDYEDFVYCDQEEYTRLKSNASEFVKRIKSMI